LDTRFLESLVAAVELGSIAAAARKHNITASAVGQRIKTLENELDVTLLTREGHKALPTAACKRLLPRAKSLIADAAAMQNEVNSKTLSGEFRLGAISTALMDNVPNIITAFESYAPNADLKIAPGSSASLWQQLEAGEIDAAIIVEPEGAGLQGGIFYPVAEQQYAVIGDPKCTPLIRYDKESWGGVIAWEWTKQNLSTKSMLCELDSLETIAALVNQGLGHSIVPIWTGLHQLIDKAPIHPINSSPVSRSIVLAKQRKHSFPLLFDIVHNAVKQESG